MSVAELFRYVHQTDPGDVDRSALEARILAACDFLSRDVDIDPIRKHDFVTFLEALEVHEELFGAFSNHRVPPKVQDALETLQRTRSLALQDADENAGWGMVTAPALLPRSRDELQRLSRAERIALQRFLASSNHQEMGIVYERMIRSVGIEDGAHILNVGDGVAIEASFLARLVRFLVSKGVSQAHLVSIDLNAAIASLDLQARVAFAGSRLRFSFHQMDAGNLSFDDGSFDTVVASFMLDDCSDKPAVLREMARVTRLGGRVCLSGHHLDAKNPADDLVHNYADLHRFHTSPADLETCRAHMKRLSLCEIESAQLPHAWCCVFEKSR